MEAVLQTQLDRVEKALTTLIDSIASYNPSIIAANDLLAADDELNNGVKQLAIHQANHARIIHLRETTDTLNQKITTNLTLLVDVRKELLATPATVFSGGPRNVPYTELLDYAKRISRYTVPPTFRPPVPIAKSSDAAQSQPADSSSINGVPAEQPSQAPPAASPSGQDQGEGIGVSSLDQKEVQWLDPLNQIPFVPWPSEEVIRQGALAQLQVMLEHEVDPSSITTRAGDEVKEGPMRDAMAAKNSGGTAAYGGVPDNAKPESRGGPPGQPAEKREEKPMVFGGLDLYDPDDD
ncbi:hypothetical protein MMC07_000337 [Pseudocyphellaria aurata]|nr:hypothetical protein [Pseudocyphellaria aurata]